MTKTALRWAPVINLPAGNCLTTANWEQTGITQGSIHLAPLLMKPGIDYLQGLPSIRKLCPWAGLLVLNADMPKASRDDVYRFRSIYDGSPLSIDRESLLTLIIKLKPDIAVLPSGMLNTLMQLSEAEIQMLPRCIYVRTGIHELLPPLSEGLSMAGVTTGRSLDLRTDAAMDEFLQMSNAQPKLPTAKPGLLHVLGHLSFAQYSKLADFPNCGFYESNRAAEDGAGGIVYGDDAPINILEAAMQNAHVPIDAHCECPTCTAKLSCAYLHHLFQHTPLLAKRYLIQHNLVKLQKHRLPADEIPI